MTAHSIAVGTLLGITVVCCWVGTIGMVRMREGMQGLHFLAPPTTVGVVSLTLAVWVESGFGGSLLKVAFTALILGATGAVASHAVGRAFWLRNKTESGTAEMATRDGSA